MLLVDGGWVERVPVLCAQNLGADVIIAVDVSSEISTFEDTSGLDVVLRSDAVSRVFLNELLLEEADISIHPDVGNVHWADFSAPRDLIKKGERAALDALMDVRTAVLHAEVPQRTLVDQLKLIKDRILERMTGKQ
jgi:NTE family protein